MIEKIYVFISDDSILDLQSDKIEIEEPTKGKEVNQEKYDEIMDKKNKEMMERYAPRKGRKGGEGIEIRIGG